MAKFSINIKDGSVKKESPIVGIDLGTTNSLIAYIKHGEAIAIRDQSGEHTLTPSVVHLGEDGNVSVGNVALDRLLDDPANTIYSVKRLLGKSLNDQDIQDSELAYKLIDNQDDASLIKVLVRGKSFSPIELSAEILKNLKKKAEAELKLTIERAVITVPAYFNDAQRQATRDAGKLAGLDVLRIVNEPTAASLAYGIGQRDQEAKKIAVYDLGGGTFDVSILEIDNGIFDVLATHGDTFLGGDDIDQLILENWLTNIPAIQKALDENPNNRAQLRLLAKDAKQAMSEMAEKILWFENIELKLDRTQFAKLLEPIVDKTISSCELALKDAELDKNDIDEVVMVGGSTRILEIKRAVSEFFGMQVHDSLNPDEVVALGAAIQADILAGNRSDMLLLDVTPLSLGIETVGGLMDTIIPRNSKIPMNAARQYTTSVDGQKNLKVAVYQGERDLIEDNRKLGEFVLKNIPPMPAGIPKIEIQFWLDTDGIMKVKAKELRSKTETEVQIKSTYGISEEEMGRMLKESIEYAQSDMAKRSLLEAINEAQSIVLSSEKFMKQNAEILTEAEISEITRLKTSLRQQIDNKDKDGINAAMDDINTYTTPLAHRALDHNIGQSLKGKTV